MLDFLFSHGSCCCTIAMLCLAALPLANSREPQQPLFGSLRGQGLRGLAIQVQLDARDKGQQPRIQEGPYQVRLLPCLTAANVSKATGVDLIPNNEATICSVWLNVLLRHPAFACNHEACGDCCSAFCVYDRSFSARHQSKGALYKLLAARRTVAHRSEKTSALDCVHRSYADCTLIKHDWHF